jgi:hypothetical protein
VASLGGAFQTTVYSPNGRPAVYAVRTPFERRSNDPNKNVWINLGSFVRDSEPRVGAKSCCQTLTKPLDPKPLDGALVLDASPSLADLRVATRFPLRSGDACVPHRVAVVVDVGLCGGCCGWRRG